MKPIDRLNLSSAALSGDADFMRRVSEAQMAILSLLRDDAQGRHELTDFHRSGLMLALEELAGSLESRAEFLEESDLLVEGGAS